MRLLLKIKERNKNKRQSEKEKIDGWQGQLKSCFHLQLFSAEQDEVEMDQLIANTDAWEIAVDRLNFREPIGRGAFGSVWQALLGRSRGRPGNLTVAAKCYLRKYFY